MELTATTGVTYRRPGAPRPTRAAESGFTLPEVLVSLVVLTLIAASVAGAFAIGFRTVGTTEAQARLAGDNDLVIFEEQLGQDINRSVCLRATGQTSVPTGGCAASVMRTGGGGSTCGVGTYFLCLAWYPAGTSACHTVVYSQSTGSAHVTRIDTNSSTGSKVVEQISTDNYSFTASWAATVTSTSASGVDAAYKWTNLVIVTFAQSSLRAAKPVTTPHLSWAPLSADPLSPAVPGGSVPC